MRKISTNLRRELDSYIQAGYPREQALRHIQSRRGARTLQDHFDISTRSDAPVFVAAK